MNKKEFVKKVAAVLRNENARKPVSVPKTIFYVSDDRGNTKDFFIKPHDREVMYTIDDVTTILDACIYVIKDSLRHGIDIAIYGFGRFALAHRNKAKLNNLLDGADTAIVAERYVPKFYCGSDLKECARRYTADVFGDDRPIMGTYTKPYDPDYDPDEENEIDYDDELFADDDEEFAPNIEEDGDS